MNLTNEQIAVSLLLLRVILGVIFFAHGSQKVMGWFGGYGMTGTVGAFKNYMHIPAPLAYLASFTEFFGGIFMIFGLLTRLTALGLLISMIVAIFKVHLKAGFFMSTEPGKSNGFEYNLSLAVVSLVLLLTGAGPVSLDSLLRFSKYQK